MAVCGSLAFSVNERLDHEMSSAETLRAIRERWSFSYLCRNSAPDEKRTGARILLMGTLLGPLRLLCVVTFGANCFFCW
jgi:hypothetical protein